MSHRILVHLQITLISKLVRQYLEDLEHLNTEGWVANLVSNSRNKVKLKDEFYFFMQRLYWHRDVDKTLSPKDVLKDPAQFHE